MSSLVFKDTGIYLSVLTLKRIWRYNKDKLPSISTRTALCKFVGYEDWYSFVKSIKNTAISNCSYPKPVNVYRWYKSTRRLLYYLILLIVIISLSALGRYFIRSDSNEYVFEIHKNLDNGVPNTVVFKYDVSKINTDEIFIQQDWDSRKRCKLEKKNSYHTSIYYFPGYFDAKLIIDDQVVQEIPLYIKNKGWISMLSKERYTPKPIYTGINHIESDSLFVSHNIVKKKGIDISKDYFSFFYNVNSYGEIYDTSFTLNCKLKNNPDNFGSECEYSEVVIKFRNGRILLPFSSKGCTSILNVSCGGVFLKGTENDLSSLGIGLKDWKDIKIESEGKLIRVFNCNKQIFEVRYSKELGKLVGVNFVFHKLGKVKDVILNGNPVR